MKVLEATDVRGRRVYVTRTESGDREHPGRFRLFVDDVQVDETIGEFLGREFDAADFAYRNGIQLDPNDPRFIPDVETPENLRRLQKEARARARERDKAQSA